MSTTLSDKNDVDDKSKLIIIYKYFSEGQFLQPVVVHQANHSH